MQRKGLNCGCICITIHLVQNLTQTLTQTQTLNVAILFLIDVREWKHVFCAIEKCLTVYYYCFRWEFWRQCLNGNNGERERWTCRQQQRNSRIREIWRSTTTAATTRNLRDATGSITGYGYRVWRRGITHTLRIQPAIVTSCKIVKMEKYFKEFTRSVFHPVINNAAFFSQHCVYEKSTEWICHPFCPLFIPSPLTQC